MKSPKEIDDGGQAFPTPDTDDNYRIPGMSLRDYFAAACLANLAEWDDANEAARHAYRVADAMIAAREGQTSPAGGDPKRLHAILERVRKVEAVTLGLRTCNDCHFLFQTQDELSLHGCREAER